MPRYDKENFVSSIVDYCKKESDQAELFARRLISFANIFDKKYKDKFEYKMTWLFDSERYFPVFRITFKDEITDKRNIEFEELARKSGTGCQFTKIWKHDAVIFPRETNCREARRYECFGL